jgi:hypothetical protein
MPRFTLRDLFLATTLIAAGMLGLGLAFYNPIDFNRLILSIGLLPGSTMMIGAGIGLIFQRPTVGTVLGFATGLIWLFLYLKTLVQ